MGRLSRGRWYSFPAAPFFFGQRMIRFLTVENWKRGIALTILAAYSYQLIAWPVVYWLTTLLTLGTGVQWPAPPIIPWEQLTAGTATLAAVGGIETWRDKKRGPDGNQ